MKKYRKPGTCRECLWSDDNPPRCTYKREIVYLDSLDQTRCSTSKFFRRDSARKQTDKSKV